LNAAFRQQGFSFVEIMVAVVLLAVCAVPMGEAIRNGIAAATVGMDKARELRCMKNTMETILAAPYQTLWDASVKDSGASYPLPDDAACAGVVRTVSITLKEFSGTTPRSPTASEREWALLQVSATSDKGYSFTSMVAR
jgi:prepilin-type N-terminal cleavage/methylation domain-containing protein